MSDRCPQCSAIVAAGDTHCADCGFPLQWRGGTEDEGVRRAPDMVRRPGEADALDDTRLAPPAARPRPARDTTGGPVVACGSCGAANAAQRTLCERCGTKLGRAHAAADAAPAPPAWWQGRGGWLALLSLAVVAGAVAGWLLLRGPAESADAGDGGVVGSTGEAVASETTEAAPAESPIVLRPGDGNEEVRRYQQLLDAAGFALSADGQFGPNTERETRRFQRVIGEEPSGAVTERTLAAAERAERLRPVDIFLLRDGELDDVPRRVDEVQLARGTLEMLIAAPLQVERDEGLSSAIPAATRVDRVRVADGTAAVALSGFAADPASDALQRRVDQVVATLTQFESIDAVVLRLPPDDVKVFADAGVAVDEPLRGVDG